MITRNQKFGPQASQDQGVKNIIEEGKRTPQGGGGPVNGKKMEKKTISGNVFGQTTKGRR